MNDPLISIVMRSFNEGWLLRLTLPALREQNWDNWELIVIDSGSRDGSVELIRQAAPRHFIQIQPQDYNPARVMNLGMKLAGSERVVFSMPTPLRRVPAGFVHWRRRCRKSGLRQFLADRFRGPIARRSSLMTTRVVSGQAASRAGWEHFFSMVSSGLRKDIWSRRGFLETMQYSEDDEYTRWCRAQGLQVVYCPDSVVNALS